MAIAGPASVSARCDRIAGFRSTGLHRTASNPGSTSPKRPRVSTSLPKRLDWPPKPARSPQSIRSPTGPGSSNVRNSKDQPLKPWPDEPKNGKNTPRDHAPISKTYLLQQHRQMGVMKQDCSLYANPPSL